LYGAAAAASPLVSNVVVIVPTPETYIDATKVSEANSLETNSAESGAKVLVLLVDRLQVSVFAGFEPNRTVTDFVVDTPVELNDAR
jgi:hypothetical protein